MGSSLSARRRLVDGQGYIHPSVDGRSVEARVYRDLYEAILSDLGGPDNASTIELQLALRIAGLSLQAWLEECRMAKGEAINSDRYHALCGVMNRLARTLGTKRRQITVPTPDFTLDAYLEHGEAGHAG